MRTKIGAKKWLMFLLTATLSFTMAFALTGCLNSNGASEESKDSSSESQSQSEETSQSEDELTVQFKKDAYSMEEYTVLDLESEVVAEHLGDETIVWATGDADIATVDGGVVTALKVGETTVKVSAGDKEATATLIVTETTVVPTLSIDEDDEMIMIDGSDYETAVPEVLWNAQTIDGVTFEWASDDEEVVSVVLNEDGSATFTALSAGEAEITLTATVRGKSVSWSCLVTVNKASVVAEVAQDGGFAPYEGGYAVEIKAVEKEEGDGTNAATPIVTATYKGEQIIADYVWATEDTDVVEVDESTGKITAKKAGNATVIGTLVYEDETYSLNIFVTVVKTVMDKGEKVTAILNRELNATVAVPEDDQEVLVAVKDSKFEQDGVTISVSDGEVTLPRELFEFINAEYDKNAEVKLETTKRVYSFDVSVINYAIANLEELKGWWNQDLGANQANNDYIVIEADIDASAYNPGSIALWGYPQGVNPDKFIGTIDGQGHTIHGLASSTTGLFQTFGEGSVMKNLSLTGIRRVNGDSLFNNWIRGTIENCYFETTGSFKGFGSSIAETAKIKNVVVFIHDRENDFSQSNGIIVKSAPAAAFENVYVINDDSNGNEAGTDEAEDIEGAQLFASAAEFIAAVTEIPESFGENWVLNNGFLMPTSAKTVYDGMYDIEFIINNTATDLTVNESLTLTASLGGNLHNAQWTISGLNDDEYTLSDGVLTVNSDSAVGKTFDVIATTSELGGVYTYTATLEGILVKQAVEMIDMGEPLIGLNRANATFDIGEDTTIEAVEVDGVSVAFTQDGEIVTIASETLGERGYKAVSVKSETKFFNYNAHVVDFLIATLEELEDWYKPDDANHTNNGFETTLSQGLHIYFEADIDASGYNHDVIHAWRNANSGFFKGIIDGQGHTVHGLQTTNTGLCQSLAADGVIRNIAFTGLRLVGNTKIINNRVGGTIENVYFETSNASCQTLFSYVENSAVIRNVVAYLHDRANDYSAQKGVVDGKIESGATFENLYVINDDCNGQEAAEDIEGAQLFASAAEFIAAVTEIPESFGENWVLNNGFLMPTSAKTVYDGMYDIEFIINNTATDLTVNESLTLTASLGGNLHNAQWTISGLNDDEYTLSDGVLTVNSDSAVGKTFDVIATTSELGGVYTYTATLEGILVKQAVEMIDMGEPLIGLNRANATFDIGEDTTIEAVEVDGVSVAFTQDGEIVTIASETLGERGYKAVSVKSETKFFNYNAHVVDFLIATLEELEDWYKPDDANHTNNGFETTLSQGLHIYFEADIDASGYNHDVIHAWRNANSGFFKGIIDGQGHTVHGLQTTNTGLCQSLAADGVIRNIAFTGLRLVGNTKIINNRVGGTIENVYFETSNASCQALFSYVEDSAVIRNVVAYLHDRAADFSSMGGIVTNQIEGKAVFENVVVVNDNSTGKEFKDTETDIPGATLYTSFGALKTAVTAVPEGFGSDWEISENGLLKFKTASDLLIGIANFDDANKLDPEFIVGRVNSTAEYVTDETETAALGMQVYKLENISDSPYNGGANDRGVTWRTTSKDAETNFGVKLTTTARLFYDATFTLQANKWYFFSIRMVDGVNRLYYSTSIDGVWSEVTSSRGTPSLGSIRDTVRFTSFGATPYTIYFTTAYAVAL